MPADTLPPLPATVYGLFYEAAGDDEGWQEFIDVPGYTADQMRDYAAAAVQALEAERGVLLSAVEEWRKLADQQAGKLTALEAERDQLRAEVEALRADAERYRWLRRGDPGTYNTVMIYCGASLDAAIDAARKDAP